MNLIEPTVGQESGPQYALDINSSLTLIDQHDHSPGKGVEITPAGININSSLAFNNNPATGLSYESFIAGSSPTTTIQAISVAPASSINELFYTDSNGTQTQITKNGTVNATAASIPGESYDAGTFIWTQTQSALPTTPANFDIGSITLRPNTAGTTNGVTLTPPSSTVTTFGFPSYSAALTGSLPSANSFLTMSTSGNITASIPVASNYTKSTSCGTFNTSSTSLVPVTNLSITITSLGNPVIISLVPDGTGADSYVGVSNSSGDTINTTTIHVTRNSTTIYNTPLALLVRTGTGINTIGIQVPPTGITIFDAVTAGTYTYTMSMEVDSTDLVGTIQNCSLVAYEL